jgi:hypothetical protein
MVRPDSDAEIMIHSHPYNLGKKKCSILSGNPSRFGLNGIWLSGAQEFIAKY